MKRFLTLFVLLLFFVFCFGGNHVLKPFLLIPDNTANEFSESMKSGMPAGDFSGGIGTPDDPYKVSSATQLNLVRNYPASHFIQMADIDLGVPPWNEGKGWVPICNQARKPFSGSYSGNGFKITNLKINAPDSSYTGLFGRAVSVVFERIKITGADIKGKSYVGSVAGQVLGGTLTGNTASGSVTGSGEFTGGIFGWVSEATITGCTSDANVTGNRFAGGLAGSGTADNSKATGKVTGVKAGLTESLGIGGLLGRGIALNCHATGEVTGADEVGGLIGSGSARGCSATGNVTATGDYAGGLIGNMNSTEEGKNADYEYMPGDPARPATVKITGNNESTGAQPIVINLDDGTRVLIPGNKEPMKAVLEKAGTDIPVSEFLPAGGELRITGSMRRLKVNGTGDALPVKPVITIPASEIGSLNPETINALRIGLMDVNGVPVKNYSAVLPVWKDDKGNFKFVDALFPDGLAIDSTKSAVITNQPEPGMNEKNKASDTRWVGEVQYFLITFDKSLNWSKRPVLVRMIPDSTKADEGFRRPIGTASATEREKLAKQPVCNVVILVHGHNEEEKGGYVASRINSPWEFNYKRLVWDLLYQDVVKNKQYPTACTAFYEFISPTYRPIFSPVQDKSGLVHKTLGEDLGNMINQELLNNPKFKAMIDNDMPFNLFLVAHSQGGLVARAGLRFVDPKILKNLRKVITWGSPHTGAGLYSLRYALGVGHDMIIDGVRFPLQNIGQSDSYQSAISALALDAPGIRDLRWDASKKNMLRLGDLFKENTATLNEFPETELPNGKMFFSENLKLFNENEGLFTSGFLSNKYKFFEGITTKNAPLEISSSWLGLLTIKKVYYFAKNATEIEKGAQLNKLVMQATYNSSDGAVPAYSQRAEGVWNSGGIERRNMGDTDHEEYYGGENPHRDYFSINKGKTVSFNTLTDMEMTTESKSCPKLDQKRTEVGDSLFVDGKLLYPLYSDNTAGDGNPGNKISTMVARRKKADGEVIQSLPFTFKPDGTFIGRGKKTEIPDDTLFIAAILKDGSEVVEELEYKIQNKVLNTTKKIWYSTIQKAVDESAQGDVITVYPGTYPEYVRIQMKTITLQSKSGPDVTIIEGKDGTGIYVINCEPVVTGLTVKGFYNGIYVWNTDAVKTLKPAFNGNRIVNCRNSGIYLSGKIAGTISGNHIENNTYYGINYDKYSTARVDDVLLISNNTLIGHNRGILLGGNIHSDVSDNRITNGDQGIEILENATALFLRDTISGPQDVGIRMYLQKKGSEIKNCLIKNCGMGVFTRDANGTYQITGSTISGNGNGIVLEMGTSKSSSIIISKNKISDSNTIWDEGGTGIIAGGAGRITITENTISGNNGKNSAGGIKIQGCDTVTITSNVISGNRASSYGGGISLNTLGPVTISKNTISNNSAGTSGGAMIIQPGTKATVTGNEFKSNSAGEYGGAIYGRAVGWEETAVVTVNGKPLTVTRYVPCFPETTNTYSGNSNGKKLGAWGPGTDKWCEDSGFDVYF